MPKIIPKIDYRESHRTAGKGEEYEKSFSDYNYRALIWDWEKQVLEKILKDYFQNQKISYLDFACGTGRIANFIEPATLESFGVDVSNEMLEKAKENVKRTELINADLTRKNIFQNKNFDLITAFRFFLNAQPELRREAISVLADLLKKNGYFVFNIHRNRSSVLTVASWIYRFLLRKKRGQFNTMSLVEVKRMTREAGLKIIKTYHFGILPINEKTWLPISLAAQTEFFFSKIRLAKCFSQNIIFVCQHQRKKPGLFIDHKNKAVVQNVLPEEIEVKTKILKKAHRLSLKYGGFIVPKILSTNKETGQLKIEYLPNLQPISAFLPDHPQIKKIIGQTAEALAIVHNELSLEKNLLCPLPTEFSLANKKDVFLHGDYTVNNLQYDFDKGKLVVLDWEATPLLTEFSNYGPAYWDIGWFLLSLLNAPPHFIFFSDEEKEKWADLFLSEYSKCSKQKLDPALLANYLYRLSLFFLKKTKERSFFRYLFYRSCSKSLENYLRLLRQRKEKINILYVIGQLSVGGGEKQLLEIARRIDKKKFNFVVCCLNKKTDLLNELQKYCEVLVFKKIVPLIDITRIFRLAKIIKKYDIDVIHNDLTTANFWGTLAGKLMRKKTIISLERGFNQPFVNAIREKIIIRILGKLADKIITYSQTNLIYFAKNADIPLKKAETVFNGVDLKKFRKEKKKINLSKIVVGTAGRLCKIKNQQMLLRAAQIVSGKIPETEFWLIGDGPEKEKLRNLAKKLNLERKIVFWGKRNDAPKLLKKIDIFALTSDWEGLPNALMEAMASGKAVIATKVGGSIELISNGKDGFLIKSRDSRELAQKIIFLINHPKLIESMGKTAAQKMKNFSIEKKVKKIETIYLNLLKINA